MYKHVRAHAHTCTHKHTHSLDINFNTVRATVQGDITKFSEAIVTINSGKTALRSEIIAGSRKFSLQEGDGTLVLDGMYNMMVGVIDGPNFRLCFLWFIPVNEVLSFVNEVLYLSLTSYLSPAP